MAGLEDGASPFAFLRNGKTFAEKYLAQRFLGSQQALGNNELGNVLRFLGTENLAGGLTKVISDVAPFLRTLQSGTCSPGTPRPLRGVPF